jgi:hypothetical protein
VKLYSIFELRLAEWMLFLRIARASKVECWGLNLIVLREIRGLWNPSLYNTLIKTGKCPKAPHISSYMGFLHIILWVFSNERCVSKPSNLAYRNVRFIPQHSTLVEQEMLCDFVTYDLVDCHSRYQFRNISSKNGSMTRITETYLAACWLDRNFLICKLWQLLYIYHAVSWAQLRIGKVVHTYCVELGWSDRTS